MVGFELISEKKVIVVVKDMEWSIGILLMGVFVGWFWYNKKTKMMMMSGVPKGNLGWPFIGETLDFIACGYTARPVSFMDKRKSL